MIELVIVLMSAMGRRALLLLLTAACIPDAAGLAAPRARLPPLGSPRAGKVTLNQLSPYEEYMKSMQQNGQQAAPPVMAPPQVVAPPSMPMYPAPMPAPPYPAPAPVMPEAAQLPGDPFSLPRNLIQKLYQKGFQASPTDSDFDSYERVPWWRQSSTYSEEQRKDRRTIFMHDDWVRHRSSERFFRNVQSIGSSGIIQSLRNEVTFVTMAAVFVVAINMLLVSYQDFDGVSHVGALANSNIRSVSLPALPFSIASPALSLLLVFRTNTGYSRWNEARTLWGGLINNCRNVVRQANTFFPDDPHHVMLKQRLAAETAAFIRALRNFLRGPTDDDTLRSELYELVGAGHMTPATVEKGMAASNRPMFFLSAMSATLRKAEIDPMKAARVDASISVLVDLTGANERIFKSPIPLLYTRLLSRFLTAFLLLLPLALWQALGESWNHWAVIPAELFISFFLFGIEEVGIQIEEPFSVLPLEAFCNGAIAATSQELRSRSGDTEWE
uniref:Uncharacterized protein n=1 Tax=Emiliania huxleyi TaxID=2903 RepID=A0A7S3RUQ3_EMIHU